MTLESASVTNTPSNTKIFQLTNGITEISTMMILLASATAAVPVLVNVNMVGLKVAVNPLWNSVFLEADSQNSTRAKIKEHRESRCSWRAVQGSNLRPVVLETTALPTELTTLAPESVARV